MGLETWISSSSKLFLLLQKSLDRFSASTRWLTNVATLVPGDLMTFFQPPEAAAGDVHIYTQTHTHTHPCTYT